MEEQKNFQPFIVALIVTIVTFIVLVMINLVLGTVALFSPLLGLWRLTVFGAISLAFGAIVFLFAWVIGLDEQVEQLKREIEDLKTQKRRQEESQFSTRREV